MESYIDSYFKKNCPNINFVQEMNLIQKEEFERIAFSKST